MTTETTSRGELQLPPQPPRVYDPWDPVPFWNNLINVFPKQEAYVVGGAVRDWVMGVEPKDIDVFVPIWVYQEVEPRILEALRWAGIMHPQVGTVRDFSYAPFCDDTVRGTVTIHSSNWPDIQIVLTQTASPGLDYLFDMARMVDRVDFGLCRVGYHPSLPALYHPPEFTKDIASKTLTLYRADTPEQHAYSLKRFGKLTAEKYEGYTLVDRTKFAPVTFDG